MTKKEIPEPVALNTITIIITETGYEVMFSDWLSMNPTKLSRMYNLISKAWRKERAGVVHADRVKRAKEAV